MFLMLASHPTSKHSTLPPRQRSNFLLPSVSRGSGRNWQRTDSLSSMRRGGSL